MKLNSIISFIILFYSSNILHAQNSLSGKITDKETNQPMPYVSISIPDLHAFTISDSLGNYHFEKLPKATYQLQISAVGH